MPQRHDTAPPIGIDDVMWDRVSELKETVRAHDRMLVEAFGQSGKNGAIGRLIQDMKAIRKFQMKMVLYALGGASAGGGLVQALMGLL